MKYYVSNIYNFDRKIRKKNLTLISKALKTVSLKKISQKNMTFLWAFLKKPYFQNTAFL